MRDIEMVMDVNLKIYIYLRLNACRSKNKKTKEE